VGINKWALDRLNQVLKRRSFEIVPTEVLYEWQRARVIQPCWHNGPLPGDSATYLRPDNPQLLDIRRRYGLFDGDVTTPLVWKSQHVRPEDIAYFRGDNAWVWQVRGKNANLMAYAITFYYLKSIDKLDFFGKLTEDADYGNFTFRIGGQQVSRDLLDSIAEIYFLDRHLAIASWTNLRVLDIGAGYGRLAHRMLNALSGIDRYLCTDAVPASTFVSDYYLRYRGLDRATVIPLDAIETTLRENPVDVAINIHSFPECRTQAIEWWIRLLSKYRVKRLMIAANPTFTDRGERLLTNDRQDFLPILERYGYQMIVKEPKFLDPVVQEYGLYPTWHHLLELHS
jgi:hypothetical protein